MVAIEEYGAACVIYGFACDHIRTLLGISRNDSALIIDNKYFTATIKVISLTKSDQLPSTSLPINAVIVNNNFEELEAVSNEDFFESCDVKLFISSIRPTSEQFQFCIQNQVEVLDIDDEPDRLMEALSSSIWPGAKIKGQSRRGETAEPVSDHPSESDGEPPLENNIYFPEDADPLSALEDQHDDFEAILNLVSRTRTEGENLSDTARRANAEHVISAIYNLLGDDSESE